MRSGGALVDSPAVQKELAARWMVVYWSSPAVQMLGRWVSQAHSNNEPIHFFTYLLFQQWHKLAFPSLWSETTLVIASSLRKLLFLSFFLFPQEGLHLPSLSTSLCTLQSPMVLLILLHHTVPWAPCQLFLAHSIFTSFCNSFLFILCGLPTHPYFPYVSSSSYMLYDFFASAK